MVRIAIILSILFFLVACQGGPKPPIASGSRYLINDENAEQILALQKELSETQKKLIMCEKSQEEGQCVQLKQTQAPVLFHIPFALSSSTLKLDKQLRDTIINTAQKAKRIDIKGRTDATHPTLSDEAIAMARAKSARNLLIKAGISPLKIYLNYTSGTDYAQENSSPEGKNQNRRVELLMFMGNN